MIRPVLAAAALVCTAALATACASAGPDDGAAAPGAGAPSATRTPFATTTPLPQPSGAAAALSDARWEAVVADLRTRGVTGEPELVSATAETFSDGSLGCPTPGQSYTQAIVEGMRVLVRADDSTFDYRFGTGDEPRRCER